MGFVCMVWIDPPYVKEQARERRGEAICPNPRCE